MRVLAVIIALTAALAVPGARAADRVALVIGNAAYASMPKLATPVNDARDLERTLETMGFVVTVGTDLDHAAMNERLAAFAVSLEGAKVGLLYFSGHAYQIGGRDLIAPIDLKADGSDAAETGSIALSSILEMMEADGRLSLVFLDASRNDPFTTKTKSETSKGGTVRTPRNTLISYATGPGGVIVQTKGRNSPYAAALIKRLPAPGVDIETVLKRVWDDVSVATSNRQIPWMHSSLASEIVLVPAE